MVRTARSMNAHTAALYSHRYMKDMLVALMRAAAADLGATPLGAEDEEAAAEPLPDPMVKGNFQRTTNTCFLAVSVSRVS